MIVIMGYYCISILRGWGKKSNYKKPNQMMWYFTTKDLCGLITHKESYACTLIFSI